MLSLFRSHCLVALLLCLTAQAQTPTDAEIWSEFARWIEAMPVQHSGPRVHLQVRYLEKLERDGVPQAEARRRLERLNAYRRNHLERDRLYWDGAYKLGDGPTDPSRLLVEYAGGRTPGRALDAGMGNGRNAIYLAKLGWQVTGYDMSAGAVAAANADARKTGAQAELLQATHENYDFGEARWDLIALSYAFAIGAATPINNREWTDRLWGALKPGGVVIYLGSNPGALSSLEALANWQRFRLLRFEDVDDYFDGWDRPGLDGKRGKGREIRIIAQRHGS